MQSFLVDGQGELTTAIANVSSGGAPPFVAGLSTAEAVIVVNYEGGNGKIIPTTRDVFFEDAPIITFPAPLNGSSHPHMALEHNGEILVPDLVRFFSLWTTNFYYLWSGW